MSRHRPYLIWLGVAVLTTLVVALLIVPAETWVALDQRRSTARTTPDGIAAWARALERLGVTVTARYTPLTASPPSGAALALLEPIQPPSAAEVGAMLDWVRGGGVLVYSPGFEELALDSLDTSIDGLFGLPGETDAPKRTRLLRHRWTEGIEPDSLLATWTLDAEAERAERWIPLVETADGAATTVAWIPQGEGGVLLLSEALVVANEALRVSAVGRVVTRAVLDLVAPGDTIVFSEYHQGADAGRGIFRETYAMTARSPIGRAILHVSVAGLALLVLAGRSFGAPAPEAEQDRRSPLEHVDALGRIYRTSSSDRRVARRLVHGAVRRLGGAPPGTESEEEVLESWAGRPETASPARLALASLRRDPPDLVRLTSALDTIVDEHAARGPIR